MTEIKKVAVLGSGVMGSGIAAHIASAGIPVLLLDIVPTGAENRNALTEKAVEKQLAGSPPGFAHKRAAKLITCGNLEDHLTELAQCDWIIEAVLERLDVKQDVYRKVDSVRKAGSVVSSNTSTLPMSSLTAGFSDSFKHDFMITHFFNPPRFMRLLEVAGSPHTKPESLAAISRFADVKLGKGVVICKDTPGFIANRIGVYWMMLGLLEAMRLGITVEQADAVMGKPLGLPKTGVFGLFDLIGIDLMPLIAKAMLATLPENDPFRTLYQEPDLIKKMIADGYTGRKGKGGFYRMNKQGEKKIKEALNLATGEYATAASKVELASIDAAKAGIGALLSHKDIGGQYASAVMGGVIYYAASLVPDISDSIADIDAAMKLGYSWKYGPFEMIDKIGVDNVIAIIKARGLPVPALLANAAGKTLYGTKDAQRTYQLADGTTAPIVPPAGSLMLGDLKLSRKPVLKNGSASLWDMGDGIACFELTSKMNAVDPDILSLIEQSVALVKKDFKGLVIGGDADNFSVGANLAFMLMAANVAGWKQISDVIRAGQHAMMALKYAPFPVVASLSGMALGGGCEIVLHSNAVQAHMESYPGLVEVGVGLIPAWGGCKELLTRYADTNNPSNAMPGIAKAFEIIGTAKVSGSAEEARDLHILRSTDSISMNRARVLADAKQKALQLAESYSTPEPVAVHLPGETGKVALFMALDQMVASGKATAHDSVVCRVLAHVLTGGSTDILDTVSEQQLLDLEHEGFMELVKTKGTLARIEHMLTTGKPLRN
jgi:3-hydroxyacyl-CoA dehydrogenase